MAGLTEELAQAFVLSFVNGRNTHTVTDLSYWGMLTSWGQISIKPSSTSSQNIQKCWQPSTKTYSHLPLNSFAFEKCSIFLALIFFHRLTTQLQARCFKDLTQVGCVCKQSFIGAQKYTLIHIIHTSSVVTFFTIMTEWVIATDLKGQEN